MQSLPSLQLYTVSLSPTAMMNTREGTFFQSPPSASSAGFISSDASARPAGFRGHARVVRASLASRSNERRTIAESFEEKPAEGRLAGSGGVLFWSPRTRLWSSIVLTLGSEGGETGNEGWDLLESSSALQSEHRNWSNFLACSIVIPMQDGWNLPASQPAKSMRKSIPCTGENTGSAWERNQEKL